jgi:hypothetical protein
MLGDLALQLAHLFFCQLVLIDDIEDPPFFRTRVFPKLNKLQSLEAGMERQGDPKRKSQWAVHQSNEEWEMGNGD